MKRSRRDLVPQKVVDFFDNYLSPLLINRACIMFLAGRFERCGLTFITFDKFAHGFRASTQWPRQGRPYVFGYPRVLPFLLFPSVISLSWFSLAIHLPSLSQLFRNVAYSVIMKVENREKKKKRERFVFLSSSILTHLHREAKYSASKLRNAE